MAWAQLVAQGVQNTANAFSVYKQGQEDAASYKYAAAQDEKNARSVAAETAMAEDTQRRQNRKQLSQLSGAMAEGGLTGSTFERIFTDSARNLEQDAANIRYQGMSQWTNLKNSAAMNRFYAAQSLKNAKTNALLTLSGATNVGGAANALGSMGRNYGWQGFGGR